MDFPSAVQAINTLLRTIQPDTFCSSWILKQAPQVYRFIQKNVRTVTGGIDWDTVTRALDRTLQRRWQASRRGRPARNIRHSNAVAIVLKKHETRLYTFLSPLDASDEEARDVISIALVRLAQRGNDAAKQEIIKLVRFTVDGWIAQCPHLSCWDGRDDLIRERIEGCIRGYRYSGSFMVYLFKTLEYAGRGLRPLVAYSLDEHVYFRKVRWIGREVHAV